MIPNKPYDVINKVPMTRFDGVKGSKLYLVHTPSEFDAFYELLMQKKLVACDTETSGFNYWEDDYLVGLSFGWEDTHFYLPLAHSESIQGGAPPPQLKWDEIADRIRAFFNQTDVVTIWHNWKFDAHFYEAANVPIRTPFHDTRILWQLYDENAPGALKTIASGWRDGLGRWHPGIVDKTAAAKEKELSKWRNNEAKLRRRKFSQLIMDTADEWQTDPQYQSMGRAELKRHIKDTKFANHPWNGAAKSDIHYGYIPVELMCEYAGLDTFLTWQVYRYVMDNMQWSKKLQELYINELHLSKALKDAEATGVPIDRDYLIDLGEQYEKDLEQLTSDIRSELNAPDLNLRSTKQLADALIAYGITLTQLSPSSTPQKPVYTLDSKVLKKLAKKHPIVEKLLKVRKIEKLKSTYVEGILAKLTEDNILHCNFNQNVATGRMSSSNPNLQNIPGRDKSIRRAFISPPSDKYFALYVDYSQVEVRLGAHESKDALLLDAYAKGQDVHTRTMCEMFGYDYEEVVNAGPEHPQYVEWDKLRTIAKRINFGIMYGVGAPGLSEQIPRPEQYEDLSDHEWIDVCQRFIDNYLDRYRGMKKFIKQGSREVKQKGYVINEFGRIRHLPHYRATKILKDKSQFWREAKAQRQGVNFKIQGNAADLFKIAVVRVHKLLEGKKTKIVSFVHDEIQFMFHKDEMDLLPKIKEAMEDFPQFIVPIKADFSWSDTNWAEKKDITV